MGPETTSAGIEAHGAEEALFSFAAPHIRDKAVHLLIDTRYDFRLQGETVVRVTAKPNHLPVLIAQLSGALSRSELAKTKFVSARQVESEMGCKLFRLLTLDHVIRFPSKYQDEVCGPAWRLQHRTADSGRRPVTGPADVPPFVSAYTPRTV